MSERRRGWSETDHIDRRILEHRLNAFHLLNELKLFLSENELIRIENLQTEECERGNSLSTNSINAPEVVNAKFDNGSIQSNQLIHHSRTQPIVGTKKSNWFNTENRNNDLIDSIPTPPLSFRISHSLFTSLSSQQ